ncbi:cytochrome c oxidase accessory protein CcoG [Loktanella sp. D2R18]|uniref:cytochrome c oxidase accessory protein CcoG n=1 Tax=Rhodobacterales TaxID=204455 RepID=UPI000DEB7925|nr:MULTISPECIES: cytochrome c oxidase accessory protein CcoG [Rhodobacterales]MDO6590074.1 cytochrome c oxidase accessory protein CcoG [Yoonia sp. 1_MG-2023]RBW45801.1 cytochrome c oxidase accessory protein CcoG [Loktanella sp. D2R18]
MSTTPPPSLYAAREPIFPKRVKGYYRNLKWAIMAVTLGIYYLTPWIRWDRGPNLPDQAVLIDLAHRRFYFFWIEIWPHEFYFVAGLLIMAGLGLFLFTSALGRVWCGYTCPQTVWTDLFILVERWIEGDRNARVRLWKSKWDMKKWRLRITKWVVWFAISVATGGAWVFYFADAPTLAAGLLTLQAPYIAWATIGVLALTTFVFGGFMREQVCNYMCPWPRIQAAMMDPETLTVAYRDWRGEPRGKKRDANAGDCIDCMACVNVCPAGIDIRDGQQMECITCALCIDACDDIMAKIGKPRGLIDYLALSDQEAESKGKPAKPIWQHILRLRTVIYTSLWSLIGVGLVFALFIRADIEMTVSPVRNPTFVTLSDGTIRNIYDIRLLNKNGEDRAFHLSLVSDDILRIELEGTAERSIVVPANETLLQRVYVSARPSDAAATVDRTELRLWVEDMTSGERAYKDTIFNGRAAQ